MKLKLTQKKDIDVKYITLPILSAIIIGCGGGGGGSSAPNPTPPTPPPSIPTPLPENKPAPAPDDKNVQPPVAPPVAPPIAPPPAMKPDPNHQNKIPPAVQPPYNPPPVLPPIPEGIIQGNSKGAENLDKALVDTKKDENKIMDIGIVDTYFYNSKKFQKPDGTSRIDIKQVGVDDKDKKQHGTMVAHVFANHNRDAKIYAQSGGLHGNRDLDVVYSQPEHYRYLHDDKNVRIFNNSYGQPGTSYGEVISAHPNVASYAATDSIFIWAAGNEAQRHAAPESLYPYQNSNAKNGWITVMAVNDSGNTFRLAEYSNKIGDKGKNWGITARGNWNVHLPATECDIGQRCYVYKRGTSFATPVVTAAVANVWTKFPWMSNHLVTMTILSSADKPKQKGQQTEGPDSTFGWGILNETRALGGPGRLDKRLLTNKDEKGVINDLFTVNFDHRDYKDTGRLTWHNNMAGDAGIYKKGTGTLYLAGENTYTAATWIEQGAIVVQKTLKNSDVTIEKDGTLIAENPNSTVLIGNGKRYYLENNGGLLKIYGKGLKIDGDYISKDQGRLAIDIDKSKLEVTGSIDMNNNSYIVSDIQNVNSVISTATTRRNIVVAKEIKNYNGDYKISNNVSRYINLSNFYMDKDRKSIWVEYNRKPSVNVLQSVGYATASSLNTAKNFDIALDELAQTQEQNEISATAVKIMNAHANEFTQMIDSLSGEIHASSQNIVVKQNQILNRTLSNRIASLMYSDKSGVWFDGVYGESKIKKEGYANTLTKTKGTQIGLDGKVTDDLTLGLSISKSTSKADFDKLAGDIKIKNDNFSAYGSYDFVNFYLSGRVGLNDSKNEVKRVVANKNSDISYKHQTYSAYAELGSFYNIDFVNLNPFVATELNKISRGAFSENLPLGIMADKKRYNTHSILAGLRSDFKFNSLVLNSNITHSYAPNPNDFSFEAKFSNMNNNINVKGMSQAKHITWLGLGLTYDVNENFTIDFKHDVSIQDGKKDNSVFTLGAVYKF